MAEVSEQIRSQAADLASAIQQAMRQDRQKTTDVPKLIEPSLVDFAKTILDQAEHLSSRAGK
jgi:hypothetical protein